MQILNARALKVTAVLDPTEVALIVAPDGQPRVAIDIRLPDRRVSAELNAKSVRRALAVISGATALTASRSSSRASWWATPSPRQGSWRSPRRGHRPRRQRPRRRDRMRTPRVRPRAVVEAHRWMAATGAASRHPRRSRGAASAGQRPGRGG